MSGTQNPVGWFEIHVEDIERAKAFYETVFQRSLHKLPDNPLGYDMYVFDGDIQNSGAMGALIKHPMRKPSQEGALVYFSCDDCAVEAERAEKSGGRIFKPKTDIGGYGFIAIVGDSEGNAIGLHSRA